MVNRRVCGHGVLDHIAPLVPELQVKIVLDHFACPTSLPLDLLRQPGWKALERMMEDPNVFVKLSAPYLLSTDPQFKDLGSLAKMFLSMRGGKGVVCASDWAYTQSRGYDARPFISKCIEWWMEIKSYKRSSSGVTPSNYGTLKI